MAKLNDLTNKTFGNWQVLYRNGSTPNKASVWRCRCLLCGAEHDVVGQTLTDGRSTKCRSCVPREALTKPHRKESIYTIYMGMKQRCYNPKHKAYQNYGGRGIAMCAEWKNSPDAFISWAFSNGYVEGLSIDRIDTDGDYCPYNCRWISPAEQAANRRYNVTVVYNGEKLCLSSACRVAGISYSAVRSRIRRTNVTPQEAFDFYL